MNSITPKGKELQVIEEKLAIPQIPHNWNYEASVAKTKQLIYKWKNITKEIAEELYIAREKLRAQGRRTDLNG